MAGFAILAESRLLVNIRAVLPELASAAPAALAFGLLLRKLLPARLPAARIPGAFADVFGEFGRGVGHGWSSCPQAMHPESRRPARDSVRGRLSDRLPGDDARG